MPQEIKTRTITVDGLSVETTDQGAQAIERLQSVLGQARKDLTDAETAHADAIKAKDGELAKKDAEIDELKKKVLDDAELDRRVQARADLIGKARAVHDADYSGKSEADIRKAVVAAKLGDEAIADKSDDYVEARFDLLVEQADATRHNDRAVATAVTGANGGGQTITNQDSQDDYDRRVSDAWRHGSMQPAGKAQ